MPLVNLKHLLEHAHQHGYAVGAFEVINLDFLKGILDAAETARAPVVLTLPGTNQDDFDLIMPAVETAATRAQVPVAIHYNQGQNHDSIIHAINQGCNGVTACSAHLDFVENIHLTKTITKTAHDCGVPVGGEIGYIPGYHNQDSNDEQKKNPVLTSVPEAKAYVARTGVDFLSVSIGTRYYEKGKPKLDYQRLKQLNEALGIPLVIHAGNGVSDDQFRRIISSGVTQIHYNTVLPDAAIKQVKNNLKNQSGNNYSELNRLISETVATQVERYMRLWGSAGRAAEVLARCWAWAPVEHLIIYNVEGLTKGRANAMLSEGRHILASIPGVRDVFTGEAVQDDVKYHYTWRVRLCHPKMVENYLKHPDYIAFTNKLFRPESEKHLSFDFQSVEPLIPQNHMEQLISKRRVS